MVKELATVASEKSFIVFDGPVVHNLYELAAALKNMKEASFKHHVNEQKNDFSSWIRDAVGDAELAAKLLNVDKKAKMASLVKDRIEQLELLDKHSQTKTLLKYGILDFLIGIIIGIIAGLIIASFI